MDNRTIEQRLDLLGEEKDSRSGGVSAAVVVSAVVHAALLVYLAFVYKPVTKDAPAPPIARYVQLIRQNPNDRQFVEAPGPKLDRAPNPRAALSDANRKASAPKATGERPTSQPGDGSRLYIPPSPRPSDGPRTDAPPQATQQAQAAAQQQAADAGAAPQTSAVAPSTLAYRQPVAQANAGQAVNWRSAIREVGKVASLGGSQQGFDLSGAAGGDKGFAQDGPISFETQWYDWGEYAQGMVARIRVNWYSNMPSLLQTGLKGVVVIRFTIHRDGRITDVTILSSSGAPPYDFAAKKAIELASPLAALPRDFPNDTERVTAMFYYNQEVPK